MRDSVSRDRILHSRVIFLGHIENIPELLRGREVLIAPSLVEEGLGLVVMEAKAAGFPSIVFQAVASRKWFDTVWMVLSVAIKVLRR